MKRKKKWKSRVALVLAAALLIAGGVWQNKARQTAGTGDVLVREREYTAAVGDITVGIHIAGKLSGRTQAVAGAAGQKIAEWSVSVGDRVKAGDELATYDRSALDKALSQALEDYQTAQAALDKAQSAQLRGMTALASRLGSEKQRHAETYAAYTRSLNQLLGRLTNQQRSLTEKLRAHPEDKTLAETLAATEQRQEMIRQLLKDGENARDEQKNHEVDVNAQTDTDLLRVQLWQEQVAAAQRGVEDALNCVQELQALREDPVVYAPCDGVVTAVNADPGAEIAVGKPLAQMSAGDSWRFTFRVEQGDIAGVSEGQAVEVTSNAYPTDTMRGRVEHIKYAAEDDGKYTVTACMENVSVSLMEGMDGYGTVILARKENVLTLSNKAIYQRGSAQYVKVRDASGELVERRVLTGFSDGRVSEVLDGLAPGDVAVVVETL